MKNVFLFLVYLILSKTALAQSYPDYGDAVPVNISGLTFDAMEPFISADGTVLFFNSLNNGINTSIHFASRINDSTFVYAGPLKGVNQQTTPRLDAVPSIDQNNRFYWISTRNYPSQIETVFSGSLVADSVHNPTRSYGNINIYQPGWIIMDAAVTHNGLQLIYTNAYFNYCSNGLPCSARLGIANRINDSTFSKHAGSELLFENINDTNYLVYAPQVSHDGLEFFFTRNPIGTTETQVCVSVRTSLSASFSAPEIIEASAVNAPEAATVTADNSRIYYHRKDNGVYKIFMRRRTGTTAVKKMNEDEAKIFPIPAESYFEFHSEDQSFEWKICDMNLQLKKAGLARSKVLRVDVSDLSSGSYIFIAKGKEVCRKPLLIAK